MNLYRKNLHILIVVIAAIILSKNTISAVYAQSPNPSSSPTPSPTAVPTPTPSPSASPQVSNPTPSASAGDASQDQTGGPESSEVLGDAQVLGATGFSDAFKWVIAGLVGTAVFLLGIKISRTHVEE